MMTKEAARLYDVLGAARQAVADLERDGAQPAALAEARPGRAGQGATPKF